MNSMQCLGVIWNDARIVSFRILELKTYATEYFSDDSLVCRIYSNWFCLQKCYWTFLNANWKYELLNLTKTKGIQFLHNTKVPVNKSLTKILAFLRSPEEIFYRNDPLGAPDLWLECSGNIRIITAKMLDLLLCFSPQKLTLALALLCQ